MKIRNSGRSQIVEILNSRRGINRENIRPIHRKSTIISQSILSLPYIHQDQIRKRKLKVVVDCVNAAGGVIVPKLLREFGCTVVEMNCDVSGIFSHTPEPIPENLGGLAKRVVAEKADVGIAVDPDVDRLVFIDENGKPFVEEYTIASAVKFVLNAEKKLGERTTPLSSISPQHGPSTTSRLNTVQRLSERRSARSTLHQR